MNDWHSERLELNAYYEQMRGRALALEEELNAALNSLDEVAALIRARRAVEVIVTDLCERELQRPRGTEPLSGLLPRLKETLPEPITVAMRSVIELGNLGAHPKPVSPQEVRQALNAGWQRDLANSHGKIGTVRQAQGDLAGARASFEQVLAIAVPLFARTGAAEAPRFLGIVYGQLADICAAQGDPQAALGYQRDSVAQVRKTADPSGLAQSLLALYDREHQVGDDLAALAMLTEAVAIARDLYARQPDEASRSVLVQSLGNRSSALLFDRQYPAAIAAAEEALTLAPSELWIATHQAHGYLLSGQFEKARAIYLQHAQEKVNDRQTFAEGVLDDFAQLRQRGIDHPDINRIEALLKPGGKPAATTSKARNR
jgi:tetratricopeptide (TPR) repeat protein